MKYFIAAVFWAGFIAVISFVPASNLPEVKLDLFQPDKLAHAAVYGLLALFLWRGLRRMDQSMKKTAIWSIAGSGLYGIVVECAQYAFFPYRYFELYDIIANIIGALLGSIVAFFLIK